MNVNQKEEKKVEKLTAGIKKLNLNSKKKKKHLKKKKKKKNTIILLLLF